MQWNGGAAIDGSKFAAVNSKDNNFTKNKLDDRIKWLNEHIDEYLRILKDMDEQEHMEEDSDSFTREEVERKLAGIAQTGTSSIKERAYGKRLILQRITWRSCARTGWKWKVGKAKH